MPYDLSSQGAVSHDLSMNLKICTSQCRVCGRRAVGTMLVSLNPAEPSDFVCATCDRANFEIAAESQKDSFLAGDSLKQGAQ